MTNEEIIAECKQRLGFETGYEMYSLCQHEKDFYNAIIKALEQQSSDDCVSRADILKQITQLQQTPMEKAERLEQLRWLENGYAIRVGVTDIPTIGIDTPEDLEKAIIWYKNS